MNNIKDYLNKLKMPQNSAITVIYLLLLISVISKSLFLSLILTLLLVVTLVVYRNSVLGFYLGVFSLSFDQFFVPTTFSLKLHMLVFLATFLALLYETMGVFKVVRPQNYRQKY